MLITRGVFHYLYSSLRRGRKPAARRCAADPSRRAADPSRRAAGATRRATDPTRRAADPSRRAAGATRRAASRNPRLIGGRLCEDSRKAMTTEASAAAEIESVTARFIVGLN